LERRVEHAIPPVSQGAIAENLVELGIHRQVSAKNLGFLLGGIPTSIATPGLWDPGRDPGAQGSLRSLVASSP
jgi:hypothetical protein